MAISKEKKLKLYTILTCFRQVLVECSKVQICLANAGVDYESRIEQTVLNKLQQVLDVDVPNIIKQKRLLTKLVLDMDLAKSK